MLGAHVEAEPPTDPGCPEDPQAGADPGETAEERLRRQVAGLCQQLQSQQDRWTAILHDLRAQMDALKEQSPGLRGPDARTSGASPRPRREPDTPAAKPACGRRSPLPGGEDTTRRHAARSRSAPLLGRPLSPRSAPSSQPVNIKVERIDSGKMVSYEDGDKTVSIRLQIRKAAPAGPGLRAEGKPAPRAVAKNLPVEPASSPHTAQPTGKETEQEGGVARRPAGQVSAKVDGTRGAVCGSSEDEGLRTTILRFSNGDVKKTLPDNRVVYYCASTGTTRTTHPGGLVVVRFPDKRTEKFYPDGSKEILFPDGTVTRLHDGREETVFPDGTLVSVARNGDKTIVFSNGQRDVHTAEFKRREYADGTVRTVYCDGRQEIKLASGRVKVRGETGSRVLGLK
ncbi:T-complex protein 10A homolog 1 isoform X2 [Eptesicus fuscus]|uniref:T-complex protein 10A homolog 1 isoform X2 n=1 Tax=Eptesicus fuscus TaxID=29078 RepID=UPI002403CEA0|nr:T-complex protein 10A homolog 1 isoform X2 [Eptesicus fuscus]